LTTTRASIDTREGATIEEFTQRADGDTLFVHLVEDLSFGTVVLFDDGVIDRNRQDDKDDNEEKEHVDEGRGIGELEDAVIHHEAGDSEDESDRDEKEIAIKEPRGGVGVYRL